MMLKLCTSYIASTSTEFELPSGKTHRDIKNWWVKWGQAHIQFTDGTTMTFEETTPEYIDVKRPDEAKICDLANNVLVEVQ